MQTHAPILLPAFLRQITPPAYLVGGSVRDMLTGSTPVDYDLCTGGDASTTAAVIARRIGGRVVALSQGGHVLYRVVGRGHYVDISPMAGATIREDLQQRDFSINAMGCSLDSYEIIDPAHGRRDLIDGRIRMTSPRVFDVDPLRLLRAHRLAAAMGFHIEPETRRRIRLKADLIQGVSGERVWYELGQILSASAGCAQIAAMAGNGLLSALFPELIPLKGCTRNRHHRRSAFNHCLATAAAVEALLKEPRRHLSGRSIAFVREMTDEMRVMIKLAGLLHDVGKPAARRRDKAGRIHFHGHAAKGAVMMRSIAARLRMAGRQRDLLETIVRRHQDPLMLYLGCRGEAPAPQSSARFYRRNRSLSPVLLLHALADEMAKTDHDPGNRCRTACADFIRTMLCEYFDAIAPVQDRPRLLDGNDLMTLFHLDPSPLIGRLLKGLETARLAGEIHTRDEAEAWVALRLKSNRVNSP